jgi:signal transduction histidine kinase/ActR/RegA family two-component response regulator
MLHRQQELERAVADRTQKLALEHDNAVREKTRAESETKKVETQKLEIERLLWESRQAERLKTEFVANMSHEVRTPLNGILGMTDLMMQLELTGDQAECLRMVKVSSDSLLALMNQVLDFSRIEAGKFMLDRDEFDFRDVVKATLEALEPAARDKGLKLRTRFSPNLPLRLIGDAARTKHVLADLFDNAIKFTEHGFVELTAEAESVRGGEATIHVQIRDTGVGIPDGLESVIFEPFRQADGSNARRHGGTGLGLAICSRLVALMNGRLWVESTAGIGSTFHFTARFGIPASRDAAGQTAQATVPDHASGLHILVVEDNAVNQKLARRLLENGGNMVTCASDGLQAIEAWSEQRFDAILIDIQMPVMDGLEATAELRKREQRGDRRTPILALTANAMQGDRERCLAAGMDGYITKPIKASELLQSIAAVVSPQSDNVPFVQSRNVLLTPSGWEGARRTTTDEPG